MGKNKDKLNNLRNLVNNIKNIDINKEKDTDQQKSVLNESSFDIAPQDTSHIHSENLEDRDNKKATEHVYKKGFNKKYQHTNSVLDYNHDTNQGLANIYNEVQDTKTKANVKKIDGLNDDSTQIPVNIPPPPKIENLHNKTNLQKNQVVKTQHVHNNQQKGLQFEIETEVKKCTAILELKNQIQNLKNEIQNKDVQLAQALLKIKQLEHNSGNDTDQNKDYDEGNLQDIRKKISEQNLQMQKLSKEFEQNIQKNRENYEQQIQKITEDYESIINEQDQQIQNLKQMLEENNDQNFVVEKIDIQMQCDDKENEDLFIEELQKQIKQQNEILQSLDFNIQVNEVNFKTEELKIQNQGLVNQMEQNQNQDNLSQKEDEIEKQFKDQLQQIKDAEQIEVPQVYKGKVQEDFQIDQDLNQIEKQIELQNQEQEIEDVQKGYDIRNENQAQNSTEQNKEQPNKKINKIKIQNEQPLIFDEQQQNTDIDKKDQEDLFGESNQKNKKIKREEEEIQNKIQQDLLFQQQNPPKVKVKNLFTKNKKKETKKIKAEEIFFEQTPEEGTNYLEIFDNLSHNHDNFNDTQSQQDFFDQNDDIHSMKSVQVGSKAIKAQNNPFKKNSKYSRQQKSFKKVQNLKKGNPQTKINNTIPDDLFQFIFIQYNGLIKFL